MHIQGHWRCAFVLLGCKRHPGLLQQHSGDSPIERRRYIGARRRRDLDAMRLLLCSILLIADIRVGSGLPLNQLVIPDRPRRGMRGCVRRNGKGRLPRLRRLRGLVFDMRSFSNLDGSPGGRRHARLRIQRHCRRGGDCWRHRWRLGISMIASVGGEPLAWRRRHPIEVCAERGDWRIHPGLRRYGRVEVPRGHGRRLTVPPRVTTHTHTPLASASTPATADQSSNWPGGAFGIPRQKRSPPVQGSKVCGRGAEEPGPTVAPTHTGGRFMVGAFVQPLRGGRACRRGACADASAVGVWGTSPDTTVGQ